MKYVMCVVVVFVRFNQVVTIDDKQRGFCWINSKIEPYIDQNQNLFLDIVFDKSCSELKSPIQIVIDVINKDDDTNEIRTISCSHNEVEKGCHQLVLPKLTFKNGVSYIIKAELESCSSCVRLQYGPSVVENSSKEDSRNTATKSQQLNQRSEAPFTSPDETPITSPDETTLLFISCGILVVIATSVILITICFVRRRISRVGRDEHSSNDTEEREILHPHPVENPKVFIASFPLPLLNHYLDQQMYRLCEKLRSIHLDFIWLKRDDLNVLHSVEIGLKRCTHILLIVTNRLLDLWTEESLREREMHDIHMINMLNMLETVSDKPLIVLNFTTTSVHKEKLQQKRGITVCFDISRDSDISDLMKLLEGSKN